MTDYEDISGKTLYITGAGVSADSGIPTFRGEDGYWTIGSANYTPQEMATRRMYTGNPGQFLLWYYRRFASYRNVPPNEVHRWLAEECNSGRANLITQNIDGLDGRAGNRDYVCIHGRLDMMTAYDDQDALHEATTGVPNIFASEMFWKPRRGTMCRRCCARLAWQRMTLPVRMMPRSRRLCCVCAA